MDKVFLTSTVKSIVSFKNVSIDNVAFRLHYMFTTPLLIVLSIAVTLTQFFGEPIRCIQRDDIPVRVINTYCWIESTFTLPKSIDKRVGEEVVYPGVEQYKKGDEVIEHAYYQWVCFMLFLHGIMFYLTRAVWEAWEGRKVARLFMRLHKPLMLPRVRHQKCHVLSSYFYKNLGRHNCYATKYFVCEILNLINAIGQICLINRFLGYEFTTYGHRVFQFMRMDQGNRTDPMIKVFPRVTKCNFHRFGSAGSVQTHDSLCILPLNIVNEKIYVFLWLWLVLLSIVSFLAVLYRIVVIMSPDFRSFLTKRRNRFLDKKDVGVTIMKSKSDNYEMKETIEEKEVDDGVTKVDSEMSRHELILRCHGLEERDIDTVMKHLNFGDWFLFNLLSKNTHCFNFNTFVRMLAKKLRKKELRDSEMEPPRAKGKFDYSVVPFEFPSKDSKL